MDGLIDGQTVSFLVVMHTRFKTIVCAAAAVEGDGLCHHCCCRRLTASYQITSLVSYSVSSAQHIAGFIFIKAIFQK